MIQIIRLILLASAMIGLFGQVQARGRLPQPTALAEKAADDCADMMEGMEPQTDLFGEAALTEAQERMPCDGDLLDCISIKGWAVSAMPGDTLRLAPPPAALQPAPTPREPRPSPYRLARRELDPPRG